MPTPLFSTFLLTLGVLTASTLNPTRQDVLNRVLGISSAGGPDANADGIVDASDAVAAFSLPPNALAFYLQPDDSPLIEGIPFDISIFVDAGNEALGSYELVIHYPHDSMTLTDVFDGSDPLLGQPSTVENRPELGTLSLGASQFASLEEPTGAVEVARLRFEALDPGTFSIVLISASGSDVAQERRAVESLRGAEITVEPTPPPNSMEASNSPTH